MKNRNQLISGISAIIEACLYIFGIVMLFTYLQPSIDETLSGIDRLQFIMTNKTIFKWWMILIYVMFGIVLIPLTLTIHENFKNPTSVWVKATPLFAYIWSVLVIASGMLAVIGIDSVSVIFQNNPNSALTSWQTIEIIQTGIGGGVEVIGGIWVLLISTTALKHSVFNKLLNYLGLLVGITGTLTIIPGLHELGYIFGLTQIIWFVWIGILMVRNEE